jgi:serine/threonine protein kinase
MPAPVTSEDLLQLVRKSKLISPVRLQGFLSEGGSVPGVAAQLAECLVREGLLTRFQATQLLRGKHRGFDLGKYRVLEPIAEGGMGRVYLCEHIRMGHRVAIKLLYPEAIQRDPLALARFQREARAAAQLNHPNVVRTHDIDQTNGHHYLVMEYVEGITLYDLVRRDGPLAVEEAVTYAIHTGLGLQHIHENCLVHRDLKPSNLLLDRAGTVKILDLGLALFRDHRRDNLTRQQDSHAILGTADFLAPEQALTSDVDIRADIYSLGCVLYYLLTARFPFGDMPLTRKLLSLHMRPPKPILEYRPDLDSALVQVLNRLMAKKPEDRPRTPLEAVHALAPFSPVPVALPPLGPGGNPAGDAATKADAGRQDTRIEWRGPRPPSSCSTPLAAANQTPKIPAPPPRRPARKAAPKPRPKPPAAKAPPPRPRGKPFLYGAIVGGVVLGLLTAAVLFLARPTTPASEGGPLPPGQTEPAAFTR